MPLFKTIPGWEVPERRALESWGTVDEVDARALQTRLDSLINRFEVLGLQVSLVNREGRTWHGASGTVDLGRKLPLSTNHIMRIASTTKLFTSVVALALVDQGELRIDDTIDRWLPNFPRADRITLGMLISHTSGIGHPPFTLNVKLRLFSARKEFTLDELIAMAADAEPYDEPGQSHQYSNADHHLLGSIVQIVSGKSIVTLMEEHIFRKLKLSKTALLPYQEPPEGLVPGWDNVYTPSLRPFQVKPGNTMLASHASTSGGMVSTASELMTLIDGLFSGKLVSAELLGQMTSIKDCSEPAFHHTGYGLGLFRIQIGDMAYLGHLGLFVGFQALVLRNVGARTSLAAVGNLSESRIFDVVEQFEEAVGS